MLETREKTDMGRLRALCWHFFLFAFLLVSFRLPVATESFSIYKLNQSPPRAGRLQVVADKSAGSIQQSEENDLFFIRRCLPAEINQVSDILTDVFFKENTNFITYQWERLTTYLSVESTYPKPGERHALFVACHSRTGRVMGVAEIDDLPFRDIAERPYMYNVAVNPDWRRRGIAKALVKECEEVCKNWNKTAVFLKVRVTATPAIAMYESLGYAKFSSRVEKLNNKYQKLTVMSKET